MIKDDSKELRTERFTLLLTDTERREWEEAANRVGLPISDFVRLVIRQKLESEKPFEYV